MFKKLLIVLLVVVVGFLAYAATRPDSYHVERTTKIDAPASVVYDQIDDFKAWPAWSPWEKRDPQMKKTYEGPPRGVGASYAWQGNDKVGEGKMTVVAAQPPAELKLRLEFIKPFASVAETTFQITPAGDTASSVVWAMDGKNNLMGKVFCIFMNMDKMIGGDFELGLSNLRATAEAEAAKKKADDEAAAKAKADAEAATAAEAAKAKAAADTAAAAASKAKGKVKPKPAPKRKR